MFIRQETYKKRGKAWKFGLVLTISWGLLGPCALLWVDNRWVINPGLFYSCQVGPEMAVMWNAKNGVEPQAKAAPPKTQTGLEKKLQ